MGKKRPERTARREQERAARQLVRDKEKLAALVAGGSAARPLDVPSSSVIEGRVRALPCPQCEGQLDVIDHRSQQGLRAVDAKCRICGTPRTLYLRIVSDEPN